MVYMRSNELHVVPVDDLIEHDTVGDCPCGPTTKPVERDDGSNGWMVTHHSLDGREGGEGAYQFLDEHGESYPPPAVDWHTYEVPDGQ